MILIIFLALVIAFPYIVCSAALFTLALLIRLLSFKDKPKTRYLLLASLIISLVGNITATLALGVGAYDYTVEYFTLPFKLLTVAIPIALILLFAAVIPNLKNVIEDIETRFKPVRTAVSVSICAAIMLASFIRLSYFTPISVSPSNEQYVGELDPERLAEIRTTFREYAFSSGSIPLYIDILSADGENIAAECVIIGRGRPIGVNSDGLYKP